ncbi:hypothetical protein MMC30_008357 [Trapelia coarctata]|nr:hypothetical protein [Trapelia coarctata]
MSTGQVTITSLHVPDARHQEMNASGASTFASSTRPNLVIFLDETESLVRVYERETQDDEVLEQLEARPAVPVTAESPFSIDLPSIGTFRSLPSPISPTLPRLFSLPSTASPAKQRRFTNENIPPDPNYLKSPTGFSTASLHFSPAASHHGHGTSFDFGMAFGTPQAGLAEVSTPVTADPDRSEVHSSHTNVSTSFPIGSAVQSPTYVDNAIWPLASIEEARLMRYFVDHLALWFDLCDPFRHFAFVIPQRAATCPPLLYAIFAVSARHLNRISTYDPYAADVYHQKCLNHLKNMMYDEGAIMDENLLAATVILRWLEEVDVPFSGFDMQSHLVGTKAFLTAQESSPHPPSGLRQAAFWVALRQEIYISFVNQRVVRWDLERTPLDRSFDPTDDCTWANRIVLRCAEILKFCFDTEGDHTVARWAGLREYCERWRSSLPESFSPIYFAEPNPENGDVLPQIWHIGDSHVTGIQHYILCMILLAVYNPSLPRLGPGHKQALKSIDDEIKGLVLTLAGMAVSNCQTPPNMVTACMGISMTGERFTERRVQEALFDILVRTDRDFAWPTQPAQNSLKEAWGWEMDV